MENEFRKVHSAQSSRAELTEYEENSVYYVGFPAPIWTRYDRESLINRESDFLRSKRLETS
jgi:hypothetical protein